MSVKSLTSSLIKWPDREQVDRAVRSWAVDAIDRHPRAIRLGYFGSYARGDWGVGSDLDLIAVVDRSDSPFEHRSLEWDLSALPVAAQLLVYNETEWQKMLSEGGRFARTLERETVWIFAKR